MLGTNLRDQERVAGEALHGLEEEMGQLESFDLQPLHRTRQHSSLIAE